MRIQEVKIYTFPELSEEVQKKVIEKWRNENDLQLESDMINENFQEKLSEEGYKDCEIAWSLAYCQGDGVAFYGFPDISKLIESFYNEERTKKRLKKVIELIECGIEVKRNEYSNHYSHSKTMTVELDYDYTMYYEKKYPKMIKLIEAFVSKIKVDVIRLSKELENEGYKALDYYNSDEYIKLELTEKTDNYEFLENGKNWR